jgi:hypothetical protein
MREPSIVGPSESSSQQLGREAEAAFSAAVAARGHLWHPTSSGNDFGVDGVLELVRSDGSVTGRVAAVQVKGTDHLALNSQGKILLPQVGVSTAAYWLARINPTLLVVWDRPTSRFYCGWVHLVLPVEELAALMKQGRTTVRIAMDPKELDPEGWSGVEASLDQVHERTQRALNERHVREICEALLCRVADAQELLVEWITWAAYGSPPLLASQFDGTGSREGLLATFESLSLAPPVIVERQDALALLINPIHHLRVLLRLFSYTMRTGWGYGSDEPVLNAAESFAISLDAYYRLIYPPDQREAALAWGDQWEPESMGTVGFWIDVWIALIPVVNLLLRDFERELRGMLFARFEPIDERSARILNQTEELLTPVARWHRTWAQTGDDGSAAPRSKSDD